MAEFFNDTPRDEGALLGEEEVEELVPSSSGSTSLGGLRRSIAPRRAFLAIGLLAATLMAAACMSSLGQQSGLRTSEPLEGDSTYLAAAQACSAPGEDCSTSKCCGGGDANMQCFQKDASFASCKVSCVAGSVDPNDKPPFNTSWSCTFLGGYVGPPPASTAFANSGCYVLNGEKILVVKHAWGELDIPGGLANPGETPEATACRETFEETGYKVVSAGLRQVEANGFHVFNCNLTEPNPAGAPDPVEVVQVMWLHHNQLPAAGWRFPDEVREFR